jgi:hypothetical protein
MISWKWAALFMGTLGFLCGCDGVFLPEQGIQSIEVSFLPQGTSFTITHPEDIRMTVERLNRNRREIVLFKGDLGMRVNYEDRNIDILLSGRYMKIEGLTFLLQESIDEYTRNLFEKGRNAVQ